MKRVLALDLGASSGRGVVISYHDGSFEMDEIHRFENGFILEQGHLAWDADTLYGAIKASIQKATAKYSDILSVGIDSWAVDYVLLDKGGKAIRNPFAYRDYRNEKAREALLRKTNYRRIYMHSGIQNLTFNTIFQLYDDLNNRVPFSSFLMLPDYFNYLLTGKKAMELTNFSTTALYNPVKRELSAFNSDLINLPRSVLSPLVYPNRILAPLSKEAMEETGSYPIQVISVGSHDTASAIASMHLDENSCYLSSGTWSLLGAELPNPVINDAGYWNNFSNEIGLDHSVRFLKNITGLFVIQELYKELRAEDPSLTYQKMQERAFGLKRNRFWIDVNDPRFGTPGGMKEKIQGYLEKTGQAKRALKWEELARAVYESMAYRYVEEFDVLKDIAGKDFTKMILVGGGSELHPLNQMIADTLHLEVEIGEKEGSVYGNALSQYLALGVFKDLKEAREALYKSHPHILYKPGEKNYQTGYDRYLKATKGGIKDE